MSGSLVSKLSDAIISAIGNVAGATVDPKAGLGKVRTGIASPLVLLPALAAAAGYVLGRRAHP